MRRHPVFATYALALISFAGYAQHRGWNLFSDVDEVRNVPRSVRDNPGVYRSIYNSYHRYSGGK